MKKIPIMYDKFGVISLHVRKTHFNKNHASSLCMPHFCVGNKIQDHAIICCMLVVLHLGTYLPKQLSL